MTQKEFQMFCKNKYTAIFIVLLLNAFGLQGARADEQITVSDDGFHFFHILTYEVSSRAEAIAACEAFAASFNGSAPCKEPGVEYGGTVWDLATGAGNFTQCTEAACHVYFGHWNFCAEDSVKMEGHCVGRMSYSPDNQPSGNPKNNGPSCNVPECGEPINPGIGNMWHSEVDYVSAAEISGLRLIRTYNSSPFNWEASLRRSFGVRWTQTFDRSIRAVSPLPQWGITCWLRRDTGYRWCVPIEVNPGPLPEAVAISRGDGKSYRFVRSGLAWTPDPDVTGALSATYNQDQTQVVGFVYTEGDRSESETYDGSGKLLTIQRASAITRFTYSNGATNDTNVGRWPSNAPACANVQAGAILPKGTLLCVTDSAGRQLQFEYDKDGRVSALLDPSNNRTVYEYDGPSGGCSTPDPKNFLCSANNLTKVTYPDGHSRTYYYNQRAQISNGAQCGATHLPSDVGSLPNALTGLFDENGQKYIRWTYDCYGRATSSMVGEGANKVELSYPDLSDGPRTVWVTHTLGSVGNNATSSSFFSYKTLHGTSINTDVYAPCIECGAIKSRAYDAAGNVIKTVDFNGAVTTYDYELPRNLQKSRTEGYGTPQARTITTSWHPTFRLPYVITEPGRITKFDYDGIGNVKSKSVTAGTKTRTWKYTYNAAGQIATVTGPRTDVASVTEYTYDTAGNLATVKNAAGHLTTLSDYDPHGHVRRIVDPNQTVTELTYHVRGWLSSIRTGGQLTSFDYDNVGQLLKVTYPDNSFLTYAYDSAHRLTSISDGLGNSIRYTLDTTGNRIAEQVVDAQGVLARQITRAFDTYNRVQSVTGASE